MWDYVLDVTSEPIWLPLALERGTAVIATDGSYNRKRGPNVSGAGWVIACWRSGNILKGSFFEFSSNASSYRGGLLGLVAIHTLVLHACWFYQPTIVTGKIICDRKLALYKLSEKGHRRICPGVAQADLFQALGSIHQEMLETNLHYEWVKSHQDSKFPWHLLTSEEQLNTVCNTLANKVVGRALGEPTFPTGPSLLPFEHSAVLINNIKITSNGAPQIRFLLGRVDAKKFYTKAINQVKGSNKGGLGWSAEAFNTADWEATAKDILGRPEGFQLWLSKQAIAVCATQKNTARIQDILDDRCPNCGKRGEDNHHLNRCTDPGCVCLFRDGVRKLTKWMQRGNQTDTELAFWIREYLLPRGQVRMANLATLRPMLAALREVAESQDIFGWIELLHGKVSTKFWSIQHAHCIMAGTQISGDD